VTMSAGVYHRRALQLMNAMQLCRDDLSSYASAAALLAVHSAISYNDALLLKLKGQRPKSEDHKQAITVIEKACRQARIEARGIKHLNQLLAAKTDVSYGSQIVDDERALALCIMAERFQAWAEPILHK
jgi:hypothetical protein